ncbi:(2Fe-2S)-binding protein [Synechococcus sp. PCC 7336]|uniref:(2Fe-2S)-binding protein n=1 Tax=Synechococcus sp. PCC 7336 TaxID=195250 RepID=UPI00034D5A16|nr:(2Fe-2S)-binding protein [Synechococcus sp. PCC 7336]
MFKRLNELNSNTLTVNIEGEDVRVPVGETVVAAVLVHDLGYTRTTPISGAPRAPLCMMGVCFECLMEIDGVPNRQACQVQVTEGMKIRRQQGVGGEDA